MVLPRQLRPELTLQAKPNSVRAVSQPGVSLHHCWRAVAILGSSGQVGSALCDAVAATSESGVICLGRRDAPGLSGLDLSSVGTPEAVASLLDPHSPDLILCPGAMTYVDGCEDDPLLAFRTNAHGPAAVASYAAHRGIPFVYFSSDYVFSGSAGHPGPYAEADSPGPLNVYGESKLQGERAVLRVHPKALVIRTSWVYGPDPANKNFISALRRQLRAGEIVRVPQDQVSTPTFNIDLAAMTLFLASAGAVGVVHVTGPELMSRYELALAVARSSGLDETLIQGVATSSLRQRALRPLRSGLLSERLREWKPPMTMRGLRDGLQASDNGQLP